jgi:ribosome-associated protein
MIAASSQDERSQHQNRRIARERLARMIGEALRPRTPRRATRPGRAAVERRLDEKRQISQRKRARRDPDDDA